MDLTAGPTLGHIIDALGAIALERIEAPRGREVRIDEIVVHDAAEELAPNPDTLLLGVGVADERHLIDLLDRLGAAGAAGLIVRSPAPLTSQVLAAARRTGVAVLGLAPAASWFQITVLLRSAMHESSAMEISGVPVGDLFSLANAIADLIGAPVTIEDRSSRVLAFSRRQEEADASRVATILGQQVPAHYIRLLNDLDVFSRLARQNEPVYIEGVERGMLPRLAVAVRSGPELLGTIWAAVPERPPPEAIDAFLGAARLAGLHLLRQREEADRSRRFHAEQLAAALRGGAGAAEAASRLGMPHRPLLVFAAEPSGKEGADFAAAQRVLVDALGVDLAALYSRTATARVGGTVYSVLPAPAACDQAVAFGLSVAQRFLGRFGARERVLIGLGGPAHTIDDLARARREADRALQVLRRRGESPCSAHYDDVYLESLLIRLIDAAVADGESLRGPLRRVRRYDLDGNKNLLATLSCFLNAGGDVRAAAAKLNLHHNTVRYRLRRIEEISGSDLADPMTRLSFLVQLRAAALAELLAACPTVTSARSGTRASAPGIRGSPAR